MPTMTVRDVVRLALPPGSTIVAGAAGLNYHITWVATLRTTLPAFADLRGGEIALLSVEAARALDERLTVASLVKRLAQAPVSAIAVVGELTQEDAETAEGVRMPLLQLPADSNLLEVEREIARLISDYDAQLERRGAQLYNVLTQQSLNGRGLGGLLDLLHERTGNSLACYGINGDLRALRGQGQGRTALQALKPTASFNDSAMVNQQVWSAPIGVVDYPSGYLAIAGLTLDAWDRIALTQGAAACALELARENAVQAAEERMRGDLVASILAGMPADPVTLAKRGRDLGYDVALPYVALLFAPDDDSATSLQRVQHMIGLELRRRNLTAPMMIRDQAVLCMLPMPPQDGIRPRELADAVRQRLIELETNVTVAIGTPAARPAEWPRTLQEAEDSLMLGKSLFTSGRVFAFNDLGVYRILVRTRETPELWSFHRETLSLLLAYDRKQDGELIKTLEAYFAHLGNLRATAEALHVHRNTLLYRLERVQQITNFDLNDADEYFALWLALHAHRVLQSVSRDDPDPTT